MKTYVAEIIPKIQRFSEKLDNITLLTNQHWVVLDELMSAKNVFIFRSNNELLISRNGTVKRGKWEYLGHNSILIDQGDESHLYRHGFFDENVLALKVDSMDEYALLVNESKYDGELNSVERIREFLFLTYQNDNVRNHVGQRLLRESPNKFMHDKSKISNEEQFYIVLMLIFIFVFFAFLVSKCSD